MKTFQQFQQDLQEFAPALAPLAPYVLPAVGAAVYGMKGYLEARKQGQGGRSQPVDYGQGGTATPRTPNVQRPSGKITSAEKQRRQALQDRRDQARERARENQATGQGQLGKTAQQILDQERQLARDAEYARQRRENPALRDAEAAQRRTEQRRANQRQRMNQAADRLGLPEQMTAPKLMNTNVLDTRTTKEKQKEIKIMADLLPFNPDIGKPFKTQ